METATVEGEESAADCAILNNLVSVREKDFVTPGMTPCVEYHHHGK